MKQSNNQYSDEHFASQVKQGRLVESEAIAMFITKNKRKIFDMVFNLNASREEAKDILLEGVTEVVFQIKSGKYRGESSPSNYLYRICKLMWYQKFRSKKVEYFSNEIPQESEAKLSEYAKVEFSDEKVLIDKLLTSIGNDCKKVLLMWSDGYNMTEISKALKYGTSQVAMNKKSTCLSKLKSSIKENKILTQLLLNLR